MKYVMVAACVMSVSLGAQTKTPGEMVPEQPSRQAHFTGFFSLLGPFAKVESVGYVTAGTGIAVRLVALELGSQNPCRVKTTFFLMGANNAGGSQRVVRRTSASPATITLARAARASEAVVIFQGQDPAGGCIASAEVTIQPM